MVEETSPTRMTGKRARDARYRATHREALRASGRAHYAANREAKRATQRIYEQSHVQERRQVREAKRLTLDANRADIVEMKICTKCGTARQRHDFFKNGNNRDGLHSICKICQKAYHIIWRNRYQEPGAEDTKCCLDCKEDKIFREFHRNNSRPDGFQDRCKRCQKIINDRRRPQERLARAQRERDRRLQARRLVLSHYGGKNPHCACCGEAHQEFLHVDHINGGGGKHRKAEKIASLHLWLVKKHFPEGFRLLCANCNSALGSFGYCPHTL